MKLNNIIAFNDWYFSIQHQNMNISLAYKLRKLHNQYTDDFEFYKNKLSELFAEFVEVDENGQYRLDNNGQYYILKQGQEHQFEEKYNELKNIQVEEPLALLTLDDLNAMSISPAALETLEPFIKE